MNGPLKDILVLDLTRVLVGPYCTMILSDLGARVIKVEAPEIGDDSRKFGPFIDDQSAYFMSLNRGKESIALNLKNSEDKKIFEQILKKAEKYMTKEAAGLDTTMEKAYKKAGVELSYMTKADFEAWLAIAKKSSYKNFAEKVPNGQKLIDMALAVK